MHVLNEEETNFLMRLTAPAGWGIEPKRIICMVLFSTDQSSQNYETAHSQLWESFRALFHREGKLKKSVVSKDCTEAIFDDNTMDIEQPLS